jgi:uncharacterized protein YndB with AHSA1/START domain
MKRFAMMACAALIASSAFAGHRSVDVEKVVDAPVAEVWKAWTTHDGLTSFFAADTKVELRVGGPYEIYFDKATKIGCNGCLVLAVQPEKMLAFTWNAPPHLPEARGQFTHVTLRFEPVGAGKTRVTLHEDGWGDGGDWDKAYDYFTAAWPRVFGNLEKRFQKSANPAP